MCRFAFALLCFFAVYGCWQLGHELFLRLFCAELYRAACVLPITERSDIPLIVRTLRRMGQGAVLLDCRANKAPIRIPADMAACYAAGSAQAGRLVATFLPAEDDGGEEVV